MIQIDNTLISTDLLEQQFVCDLQKCKGACCEEGDVGAPLEASELHAIAQNLEAIKPYMTAAGLDALHTQGFYEPDPDGGFVTTTLNGKDCVFATRNAQGILKCSIEQAHLAGESSFKKPISCYLYPVRITPHRTYDAVNYDRWHICAHACTLGKNLKVPVYQFLKAPLVQKYGQSWYDALHTYYSTTQY